MAEIIDSDEAGKAGESLMGGWFGNFRLYSPTHQLYLTAKRHGEEDKGVIVLRERSDDKEKEQFFEMVPDQDGESWVFYLRSIGGNGYVVATDGPSRQLHFQPKKTPEARITYETGNEPSDKWVRIAFGQPTEGPEQKWMLVDKFDLTQLPATQTAEWIKKNVQDKSDIFESHEASTQ